MALGPAVREREPQSRPEPVPARPVPEGRRAPGDAIRTTAAHPLPPDEHQQEVLAHHEQKHHEDEQVEVGEEAGLFGIIGHVPGRVDVNQPAYSGHDQGHQHGKRIEQERKVHAKTAERNPGLVYGKAGYQGDEQPMTGRVHHLRQREQRIHKRDQHHAGADVRHRLLLNRFIFDKEARKGVEHKPQ